MTKRAETITEYLYRLAALEATDSDKYEEVYNQFREYLKTVEIY